MRKLLRFIISLNLVIICILVFSNSRSFDAKQISDDFDELYFEATPKITDSKKFICKVTWMTEQKIKYLDVRVILSNNFEQTPYQSGRDNSAGTYNVEERNGKYYNELVFEIYYHQLGNIKTVFDYSYDYVLNEQDDNIKSFTYIFITGKWTNEKKPTSAIICGLIISIASAIVTYVVINNTQKSNFEVEDEILKEEDTEGIVNE